MNENFRKSDERSDRLRADGNQFYAQRKFYDALVKYNESLCEADPDGERMGLAFANRSAAYFEMKLYERCLNNIGLAKRHHYPEKNFEVLKRREEKCLELMKQQKDETRPSESLNFFKLSHPPNKKLPFIADCLELKVDEKFGRHIVTNRDLKVGDVIVVEDPFCWITNERFIHQKCAGCFNDNMLDLQPCRECRKAMFCSTKCASSFESFHKLECPSMEQIFSPMLTSTLRMALRTFLVSLSLFGNSVENLEKFLSNNVDCTIFDVDSSDMKQKLLAMNSLVSNGHVDVNETIFEEIFCSSPSLKAMWSSHKPFITSFLKKQAQIVSMNFHEVYGWPLKKGGVDDDDLNSFQDSLAYKRGVTCVGTGGYPFCSMLNHHCSPNVSRTFIDEKNVLIVQRSIKRGEQLFDNYGFSFTNVAKDDRRMHLLKQYRFKCNCEACVNDWPFMPALKILDKACLGKAKKACRELKTPGLSHRKAKEKFKELCEVIERNQKSFPTLEVCSLMESASAYLEMISKPLVQFT